MVRENRDLKWMMTEGSPILGTSQNILVELHTFRIIFGWIEADIFSTECNDDRLYWEKTFSICIKAAAFHFSTI